MLHLGAQKVLADYGGSLPGTAGELKDLPGIGPYTAGLCVCVCVCVRARARVFFVGIGRANRLTSGKTSAC